MRIWHEWTDDERDLFKRMVYESWQKGDPDLVSCLEGLKLEMFCRPLTLEEIARGNNVLDAIKMGLMRPVA